MKYFRVTFLIILMFFLNSSLNYAQTNADIDTGTNSTYYQYEQGSNRLEYTLTASKRVMYYLYDNNGNVIKKIPSANLAYFASSKLKGWEAYKLSDNNPGTLWSSKANGNENSVEWVVADLGRVNIISQASLTPRATLAFPKDFKIQSSYDAVTWTDIPGQVYSNYINNGSVQTFQFGSGVAARYIRVYATKLTTDDRGTYYFQLADFNINQSNVSTSSNLDGWEATKLTDNNPSTIWSSVPHGNEAESEWIVLGMGDEKMVGGISLTPRANLSFPKEFKIQSSNDAVHWTDIPNQTYSNYYNNGSVQTFNFGSSVLTRYIRVYVTKLGKDDIGNYYFQLAEIKANLVTVATSSNLDGWEATKLTDNNPSTIWSSVPHSNEAETEWIVLGMGDEKMVGGISLTPRANLSFPKEFKIQSSNDAVHWTDIPNQTYSNYYNNGSVQTFNFGSSVLTRYIRIYATKLGKDDIGNYYFQLAEIKTNLVTATTN